MLRNTPEMVEAHYAVPALNAVLNTLNTRLDVPLLAWQMNHCEAAVLLTDREFAPVVKESLGILKAERGGTHGYEALLAAHAPLAKLPGPADEWDATAVSYTSGTTGWLPQREEPRGLGWLRHRWGGSSRARGQALR
jgi:fatty-acyl-CoA synthase